MELNIIPLYIISVVWIAVLLYIKRNDIDVSLNTIDKDDIYIYFFFVFFIVIGSLILLLTNIGVL